MKIPFHYPIVKVALSVCLAAACSTFAQAPAGGGTAGGASGAKGGGTASGGTATGGTTSKSGGTTSRTGGAATTTTTPGGTIQRGTGTTGGAGNQPTLRQSTLPNQPAQQTPGQQQPTQRNQTNQVNQANQPNQPNQATQGTQATPGGTTTTTPNQEPRITPGGLIVSPDQTTTTPGATTATPPTPAATAPAARAPAPQTGSNNTSLTANSTVLQDGTLVASGTIGDLGTNSFSVQTDRGRPENIVIGGSTIFVDLAGNTMTSSQFARSFQRGRRMPATVHYTRAADGSLVASRVVLNEQVAAEATVTDTAAEIDSVGTVTEVSPGIIVIEQPGASDTPVRYVNNKTTNYVDENGEPVPPESVKPGTPVKIFYTKVGDTLVASKVEVRKGGKSGLPAPAVKSEQTTTTRIKEEK